MTTQSQVTWVYTQLIAGRHLTPMDALRGCGSLRLGARIYEIKQRFRGLKIHTQMVKRGGKRVAEYSRG